MTHLQHDRSRSPHKIRGVSVEVRWFRQRADEQATNLLRDGLDSIVIALGGDGEASFAHVDTEFAGKYEGMATKVINTFHLLPTKEGQRHLS